MSSHNAAPSCVLVVVAMDVELQAVLRLPLERRQSCGEASEGGSPSIFHQFADGERTVWVVQSGIGPVMGALAAQEAVLSLAPRPELVLSLGVGGALAASLAPGDLVLAARVVKHDTRCGGALMRPGELWLSDPHRHERNSRRRVGRAERSVRRAHHDNRGRLLGAQVWRRRRRGGGPDDPW